MGGTMYRIKRHEVITNEEKVAKKIANLLTDLTIDLDKVGYHLAHSCSYLWYARAMEVLEAAQYNKEVAEINRWGEYSDTLF
jgi:dTDP-4-dehydrorhamnose reductase